MGALTDTRKRRFLDHQRLPFFGPYPNLLPDLPPPPKKSKLPSSPLPPAIVGSRETSPPPAPPPAKTTAVALRRFPPAAPLPRPVHGPQRILRAFGLGSAKPGRNHSRDPLLERNWDLEMGNFLSSCVRAKKDASSTPWRRGKREEVPAGVSGVQGLETGSHEGLGLENYKRFVSSVSQSNWAEKFVKEGFPQPAPEVLDLELVTEKVEDERKVAEDESDVAEQSTPVREEKVWGKKSPWYKKLYEDSIRRHDSKLSSLELEVKLTEQKISSFRLAREPLVKKPEGDLGEPFVPLADGEEDDVDRALHGRNRCEVLAVHKASNVEITREILQCLSNCAWLNDEVINLYLELLKERERREPKKFLKCHFFNTFFYKKLISGRNGYDFKAVRRWTTQRKIGYGLIECNKIFVPIHKEVHWCLAVINIKDKKFQYLDSLGGMDATVLRVLARYFMDEVKDKSDKQIDAYSWKQEAVAELPLQKNGWDCGMFMLKYADFYSRGLSLCFGQEHMPYFRKRTAKEILRLRAE